MTIKRFYYSLIRPFLYLYYFVFKPKTFGVKMLVKKGNKFLYIRNSYGLEYWTFPGGGINRNELPEHAAIRETLEETGIPVAKPISIGTYKSTRQYKRDTVYCFYTQIKQSRIKINPGEILTAEWKDITHLPEPRSFAVNEVLNLYKKYLRSQ